VLSEEMGLQTSSEQSLSNGCRATFKRLCSVCYLLKI